MKRVISLLLIVCALLTVFVACKSENDQGKDEDASKVVVQKDDIEVTKSMMKFFINDYIANWYSNYYIYIMYGMISLDMFEDYQSQVLTSSDVAYMGDSSCLGWTWYEFFLKKVISEVEMYVTYAAAAQEVSITLSDEDEKDIDEKMEELSTSLDQNGMDFEDQYGDGVTEGVVRRCYELIYLASAYAEHLRESYENQLRSDVEKLYVYVDENKEDFYYAKCLSYTISISERTFDGSQKKFDEGVENIKTAASKIASAKNPEEFIGLVELYKKSPSAFYDMTDGSDLKPSEGTDIESLIPKYEQTFYYSTGDEIGDWIFGENDSAKINDTYVYTENSTEYRADKETDEAVPYDQVRVTAYMLISEPDMDRSYTHNFAYLISNNKEAAEAFLQEFKSSATKDCDVFETIAEKHWETINNRHDNSEHKEGENDPTFNYAVVSNGKEKYFSDAYNVLNEWIDDDSRNSGDYTEALIEFVADSGRSATNSIYIVGDQATVNGSTVYYVGTGGMSGSSIGSGSIVVGTGGMSGSSIGSGSIVVGTGSTSGSSASSDSLVIGPGGMLGASIDGVIGSAKETYYAVLYFDSHDAEAWYVDALFGATQKMIDDWYEAELAKDLIEYDWDTIKDIDFIQFATNVQVSPFPMGPSSN